MLFCILANVPPTHCLLVVKEQTVGGKLGIQSLEFSMAYLSYSVDRASC